MSRRAPGLLILAVLAGSGQTPVSQTPRPRDYVLGPEDQITIRVLDAEEVDNKPVRVNFLGYIRLPLVGRMQAGGLTVDQLETELVREFKKYIKDPQAAVSITEFRSQPVSVLGAVRNPGVHQVRGRKTLLEMISMAGGIDQEAGHNIMIMRRKEYGQISLKSAVADETGECTVADVGLSSILEARNRRENMEVKPNDVITVPRGQLA
jgi:polysaccharide biosynthesis/export protein